MRTNRDLPYHHRAPNADYWPSDPASWNQAITLERLHHRSDVSPGAGRSATGTILQAVTGRCVDSIYNSSPNRSNAATVATKPWRARVSRYSLTL